MTDNRNTILAVILSGLVLIAWQYFYNVPQMEKQRAQQPDAEPAGKSNGAARRGPRQHHAASRHAHAIGQRACGKSARLATTVVSRDAAIAASPRIKIETPSVSGSISLKGARIDDLALIQFRETVDPASPPIMLFSPSGTASPYYAEFGWVAALRLDRADARSEYAMAAGRLRQT